MTNEYLLYEGAMQVVPLLLIALFVDNRSGIPEPRGRWKWLIRFQDRAIAALGFTAFFVSMFVLVGTIEVGAVTNAIVIAALSGSIGLLFGIVWRRFAVPAERPTPDTDDR